jgi:hypothetical protein
VRDIKIPEHVVRKAIYRPPPDPALAGNCLVFAVSVDWPELRLTEDQIVANAVARVAGVAGAEPPYPDHSIFTVTLPFVLIE